MLGRKVGDADRFERGSEFCHRIRPGCHDRREPVGGTGDVTAAKRRYETGAHEAGLPASGCADDDDKTPFDPGRTEPVDQFPHQFHTAKEDRAVGLMEGTQTAVGVVHLLTFRVWASFAGECLDELIDEGLDTVVPIRGPPRHSLGQRRIYGHRNRWPLSRDRRQRVVLGNPSPASERQRSRQQREQKRSEAELITER